MFCKNCGKELNENAKFCGGCGAKVGTLPNVGNQETQEKKFHITGLFVAILLVAIIGIPVSIWYKNYETNKAAAVRAASGGTYNQIDVTQIPLSKKNPVADNIIDAAKVKNYDKPIKGVIFVEEGANLNLRSCPQASDDCEAIDKISPDTEVSILGETADGEWYKIKHQNLTGFANSKFVIDKKRWDRGVRRSYVGILTSAYVYDTDGYGEYVAISIKDFNTGKSENFSAPYGIGSDAFGKYGEIVKILIDKEEGEVEKIELVK
jgi:hypothetical protein